MRVLGICMGFAIVLLSGCAQVAAVNGVTTAEGPASGKGAMLPGSDIRASGFLGNYGELKPVAGERYLWRYEKRDANWKGYDKVLVEPLAVRVNPETDHPGIQPELYGQIDRLFKEVVAKEFRSHGYQIADGPGPGVLVLRGALTGVTAIHQEFEPSDVLPIKVAVNAGKYALGAEPYHIVLSGEIEMVDGASGERVFAAVGARRGFQTTTKTNRITWTELKDT